MHEAYSSTTLINLGLATGHIDAAQAGVFVLIGIAVLGLAAIVSWLRG